MRTASEQRERLTLNETEKVEAYVHPLWRASAFANLRIARRMAAVVGLAIFYFIAGKLGLHFATLHPNATDIWAPTGISLAGVLVFGPWVWPGIFVGAFLANLTTAGSLATSIGIATGNTLEALVGAYLVNRFAGGTNSFHRTQNVFKFFFLAAILSTTISATIGVTSLCLGGYARWSNYHWIWLTWWFGDACGDMIVAPFLILWCTNPTPHWSRAKATEAVLLFISLTVMGAWCSADGYQWLFSDIRLVFSLCQCCCGRRFVWAFTRLLVRLSYCPPSPSSGRCTVSALSLKALAPKGSRSYRLSWECSDS
jgi:integral membrane sensor domain MASE1